jgi:8-oxo-dGTP diphosphatase
VDLVVFCLFDRALRVLLIRRGRDPFAGKWAIPGGFIDMDEAAETGARRELKEETGLEIVGPVEPIGFFADPGRDPRGRTITLAHAAVLPSGSHPIKGGDDAAEAHWISLNDPVDLAFDHAKILAAALEWLRHGMAKDDLAVQLLPGTFAPGDARVLYKTLNLPARHATAWLEKMVRSGQMMRLMEPAGWFQQIDPSRRRGSR